MPVSNVQTVIDNEIAVLEARLSALRVARAALASKVVRGIPRRRSSGRVGRAPGFKVSAATKAKLRAAWKRRKAARTKSAQ